MRKFLSLSLAMVMLIPTAHAAKGGKQQSGPVEVNCSSGESLQAALSPSLTELHIVITGTCRENIRLVEGYRVKIEGKFGASIIGSAAPENASSVILVGAGNGLILSNLNIRNGGTNPDSRGLLVFGGAARLDNVEISDFDSWGAIAEAGASLRIFNSRLVSNDSALLAVNNSYGFVRDTSITQSTQYGVAVDSSASVDIGNSTINTSGQTAVNLARSSTARVKDTVISNSRMGISLDGGSSADITSSSITDSSTDGIRLSGSSYLRLTDSEILRSRESGIAVSTNSHFEQGYEDLNSGSRGIVISGADIGLRVQTSSTATIQNLSVSNTSRESILLKENGLISAYGPATRIAGSRATAVAYSMMKLDKTQLSGFTEIFCKEGSRLLNDYPQTNAAIIGCDSLP